MYLIGRLTQTWWLISVLKIKLHTKEKQDGKAIQTYFKSNETFPTIYNIYKSDSNDWSYYHLMVVRDGKKLIILTKFDR